MRHRCSPWLADLGGRVHRRDGEAAGMVWLALGNGSLFAQTGVGSLESEFAVTRGAGADPAGIVPAFVFTLFVCAPAALVLAYLILSLIIARWDYRRAISDSALKKESFASSAILLVIGYLATFVMVGATSDSWVMSGINITTNLLWGVTILLFYFLYRFAKADYSLSARVKAFYGGSLVLAAVLSNLFVRGWSPVELATNSYGATLTIALYGALAVLVLLYFTIGILKKQRRIATQKRELDEAARLMGALDLQSKREAGKHDDAGEAGACG
ncbi:MAG: hypothetical protein HUU20_00430 [Pirellulales bacterium]|nr:hypothetical protein [Pirellulales bacterium]